jgi:hypothetical protein
MRNVGTVPALRVEVQCGVEPVATIGDLAAPNAFTTREFRWLTPRGAEGIPVVVRYSTVLGDQLEEVYELRPDKGKATPKIRRLVEGRAFEIE